MKKNTTPKEAFISPPPTTKAMDRFVDSHLASMTGGISPTAIRLAFEDWLAHLALSPDEQGVLVNDAGDLLCQLSQYFLEVSRAEDQAKVTPLEQDRRFLNPGWNSWPFNALSQYFLITQHWWELAATSVPGVSKHHQDVVRFTVRQLLDTASPANFIWTNPEVLALTTKTHGLNLVRGFENLLDRLDRIQRRAPPLGAESFQVGKQVAVTPGKVIYRNRLIELIQYEAVGDKVRPEPILIVSAWIMKYYILDLSPQNSLIKYLVDQGHTVFAISWLNPGSNDRDVGMEDYLNLGVMEALKAINVIVPKQQVHGVGYCLGGTLLAIAAAAMGGVNDDRFASISLFTSQVDFTEPGELSIFIDESQIAFLENMMWEKGYLDTKHMNGAFQLLNSTDLLWSRILKNYLLGERSALTDLTAWNADGTRLPYRMHSEYLRSLYLNNDLASGRYRVADKSIALSNIHCPIFCVATERDHVAPWRSVYKMHLLTSAEVTFVLTSGGHNVGIVNPPGVQGRSYQALTQSHGMDYLDPEQWLASTRHHEGSWWPYWLSWLDRHSGKPTQSPAMGAKAYEVLCDAPGTYVLQR
jgi:polyhydroxyalkanoate synthase